LHQGYVFQLVKDRFLLDRAPKKIVSRELVRHPGAVVILPFTPRKKVLLIRQFRYAASGDLWEIPAGTREKGETPRRCATRELEEETGYKPGRLVFLTHFYSAPGLTDERMHLFLADRLKPGRLNLDHDEWIQCKEFEFEQALRMVRQRKIHDAKTIVGLLWAKQFYLNRR